MSVLWELALIQKYGIRMSMKEVAEVLGMSPQTLANRFCQQTMPISTYNDSGKFCLASDVAKYIATYKDKVKQL